jgi:hypothetical protein
MLLAAGAVILRFSLISCAAAAAAAVLLSQVGSKITTAVDTFSFGIMMWELYTGQRAYSGLGRDAIIDR